MGTLNLEVPKIYKIKHTGTSQPERSRARVEKVRFAKEKKLGSNHDLRFKRFVFRSTKKSIFCGAYSFLNKTQIFE